MNPHTKPILEKVKDQHPDAPIMKGVMAASLGLSDTSRLDEAYKEIISEGFARLESCSRTRGVYLTITPKGERLLGIESA